MRKIVINGASGLRLLILEPWADEISISPMSQITISISADSAGQFDEIEVQGEIIIVHCRDGAKLNVNLDGKELRLASTEIPSL